MVHLDYELAESKAMLEVFPTTRVVGCNFHWKQVIIQIFILFIFVNLLLFTGPEEEHAETQAVGGLQQQPEVQVWFRKIWSLSLVPHNKIVETYEKIRDDVPVYEEEDEDNGAGEQLNLGFRNYLYYLEKTWIGLQSNKTRGDKAGHKRSTQRYPWSSWNHRDDLLESREITSNQSESYNSSSKVSSSNFICSSVTSLFSGQSSCKTIHMVRPGVPYGQGVLSKEAAHRHRKQYSCLRQSWKEEEARREEEGVQEVV